MYEGSASSILARAVSGRVLVVFASDAVAVRRSVVEKVEQRESSPTVVSIHWHATPPLEQELDKILTAMAEAASALWPRWYATVDERFDRARWPTAEIECRLDDARAKTHGVSAAWFRKAWAASQRKLLPIVPAMTASEQLRQLALALDCSGPLVIPAVSAPEASRARIHALARAAEWLAAQAQVAVALVLPEAWTSLVELDVVNYDSIHCPGGDDSVESEPPLLPGETRVLVEPTVGQPHPSSLIEQKLHRALFNDNELAELFQFNRRVVGYQGSCYCVDLVWLGGAVVVEIDGADHRSLAKYNADRDRDYRLLLAGYNVLRVTNDDVAQDVALVLEKIRNVVHLRTIHEGRR